MVPPVGEPPGEGFPAIEPGFIANDFSLILSLVLAGGCIGLLPSFMARPHVESPCLPERRVRSVSTGGQPTGGAISSHFFAMTSTRFCSSTPKNRSGSGVAP